MNENILSLIKHCKCIMICIVELKTVHVQGNCTVVHELVKLNNMTSARFQSLLKENVETSGPSLVAILNLEFTALCCLGCSQRFGQRKTSEVSACRSSIMCFQQGRSARGLCICCHRNTLRWLTGSGIKIQ